MVTEKLLDKLAKIKAHAESAAKIGSTQEAETFSAMLQQLLLKHKLSMSDIEVEQQEKDEPVGEKQIHWQGVKVRKTRVAWIEKLSSIVARAFFCRILVHPGSSLITLVGRASDIACAEYLIVVLTRSVEKMSLQEYDREWLRVKNEEGSTDSMAGFRASWIQSFIHRISQRFEEERNKETVSNSTALVRFNKADLAVTGYMSRFTRMAAGLNGQRGGNSRGHQRGREAADKINLRANGIQGGKPVGQLT